MLLDRDCFLLVMATFGGDAVAEVCGGVVMSGDEPNESERFLGGLPRRDGGFDGSATFCFFFVSLLLVLLLLPVRVKGGKNSSKTSSF